ncbi:MAG: VCBS repeat-containing protein [Deltaproteobacteria bacterium]|nr:MAG: VCBS repeat-containing protein [Deltaproteobacteria bacterium]
MLLGRGSRSFAPQIKYPGKQSYVHVALADMDGDGIKDIVASNYVRENASVDVLLGHADGSFGSPITSPAFARPYTFDLGDINGDGTLDIAAAGDGGMTILLNNRCIAP